MLNDDITIAEADWVRDEREADMYLWIIHMLGSFMGVLRSAGVTNPKLSLNKVIGMGWQT